MVTHSSSLRAKVENIYSEAQIVLCNGIWNSTRDVGLETIFSSERRDNFHRPDYPFRISTNPEIVYTPNEAIITFNFTEVYLPKSGVVNRIAILSSLGSSSYREIPVTVDYGQNMLMTSIPSNPFGVGKKFYEPSTNQILTCTDFQGTIDVQIPPSINFVVPIGAGVILATFKLSPITCSDLQEKIDFKIVAKETMS